MRTPWKPDRLGEAGEENPSATLYCRGDLSECDHALEQRRSQLMGTRARMADETRCTYQSRLRARGVSFEPDVAAEVTSSGADARGCGARLKPANRQSLGALAATSDTTDTVCRARSLP